MVDFLSPTMDSGASGASGVSGETCKGGLACPILQKSPLLPLSPSLSLLSFLFLPPLSSLFSPSLPWWSQTKVGFTTAGEATMEAAAKAAPPLTREREREKEKRLSCSEVTCRKERMKDDVQGVRNGTFARSDGQSQPKGKFSLKGFLCFKKFFYFNENLVFFEIEKLCENLD